MNVKSIGLKINRLLFKRIIWRNASHNGCEKLMKTQNEIKERIAFEYKNKIKGIAKMNAFSFSLCVYLKPSVSVFSLTSQLFL